LSPGAGASLYSPGDRAYSGGVPPPTDDDEGSYRTWREACPPYSPNDDTGRTKPGSQTSLLPTPPSPPPSFLSRRTFISNALSEEEYRILVLPFRVVVGRR
jgi:hypothetical protein